MELHGAPTFQADTPEPGHTKTRKSLKAKMESSMKSTVFLLIRNEDIKILLIANLLLTVYSTFVIVGGR